MGASEDGAKATSVGMASSRGPDLSFIMIPVRIVVYLMAGLATIGAFDDGLTTTFPFFNKGPSSSSAGSSLLLAAIRSSICFL